MGCGYGWIYLIKEIGDDMMYKIGVTKSVEPETRIKKLQTGNGNKLIMINKFLSSRPFKLESMMHKKFENNREEGEWFLLSKEEVESFIPLCEKYEDIIHVMSENPFF